MQCNYYIAEYSNLWIEGDFAIQSLVCNFFQQLYIVGQLSGSSDMVRLILRLVMDLINATLLTFISNDEVKKTVF